MMSDKNEAPLERALEYPFDLETLFQKKKAIRRLLAERDIPFLERRIAILGGSTSAELRDMLELFLLKEGIRPVFYESDYNRYYEDVMFDNPALVSFHPEIIYFHTTWRNIQSHPAMSDSVDAVKAKLEAELNKVQSLWTKIQANFGAVVIQNNVELPPVRLLGNLDFKDYRGKVHFVHAFNARLAEVLAGHDRVLINDIHYLAAAFGLDRWHDHKAWHAYKYACAYDAIPLVAHNVSRIIAASCGKSRKGVIVDLDNTLWGGVVGEEGVNQIQIGHETPEAEAYSGFQSYLKDLRARGIVLGVASKNEAAAALEGLNHPESLLKPEDFVSIQTNWDPKDQSVKNIAKEANLGVDSFVFVDDNAVERDWARSQIPDLAVPDVGTDVTHFAQQLDRAGYFEPDHISSDDLARNQFYKENRQRAEAAQQFSNYDEFLRSLEMRAEIGPFCPVYLDRIAQLINKTNQFNLTTRRLTAADVEKLAADPRAITLYGKLSDRFGDNGWVTLLVASQEADQAHLDLWLMSCRVLKRRMENALLKVLLEECRRRGISRLIGYYYPTTKNGMVRDFYQELGFTLIERQEDGRSRWALPVTSESTGASDVPMTIERMDRFQLGKEEGQ